MLRSKLGKIGSILVGIAVWFVATAAIGFIGGILSLNEAEGLISTLYLLAFTSIPAILAVLAAVPIKKPNAKVPRSTEEKAAASKLEYVINPKTMIIHRGSCPYAQKTMTVNKHHTGGLKAAIDIGYKPCEYCKPR